MAIFKCKMCGGALDVHDNEAVAVCEYCGSKQTVPTQSSEVITNLFNRANNLRLKNEFDKAAEIYGKILDEDDTNSEAHWCLLLCKYGIEYVEDPKTYKRIPTCHRAQYTSVLTDPDYIAAVENADAVSKEVYTEQAHEISELQKSILAIVKNEKPFDVFICYKESDENGKRTVDSALANDIYYQLTKEGLRVFYAAITLEDKLGQEYEPYIFAALNSAKIMLVIGTKPEYFEAVWVRNEWSRFLSLMKNDRDRMLIPCYRDMDAYELPEEFAHLQAQDMAKIGFINDLVRGIKKVTAKEENKPEPQTVIQQVGSAGNMQALLKRGYMALEDGEWDRADGFFEEVLNLNAECAEAYLGKLLAELHVNKQESLKDQADPFDSNNNFQKVVRFGDDKLKSILVGYIEHINIRNENARLDGIYSNAKNAMSVASTENAYNEAARLFETIGEYLDSANLAHVCYEKAEISRKDAILADGKAKMSVEAISNYEVAFKLLESISGWKDADEQIVACKRKIEEIKEKEEEERLATKRKAEELRISKEKAVKKRRRAMTIITLFSCACVAFVIALKMLIIPDINYKKAVEAVNAENYGHAYMLFNNYPDYKDTKKQIKLAKLKEASAFLSEKEYDEAYSILEEIGETEKIDENIYNRAVESENSGDDVSAYMLYEQIVGYKDAKEKIAKLKRKDQKIIFNASNKGDIIKFGKYEQDDNSSNGKEMIEWIVLDKGNNKLLVISKYALDCMPYNQEDAFVTWDTCSLRKWLNNSFFNKAFKKREKSVISSIKTAADKNPEYGTDPGNVTQDKIFILSIAEAEQYLMSYDEMTCKPTAFAKANGAYVNDQNEKCWFWLRTPGYYLLSAAYVSDRGSISNYGFNVYNTNVCVRPAMWIDLS